MGPINTSKVFFSFLFFFSRAGFAGFRPALGGAFIHIIVDGTDQVEQTFTNSILLVSQYILSIATVAKDVL